MWLKDDQPKLSKKKLFTIILCLHAFNTSSEIHNFVCNLSPGKPIKFATNHSIALQ